MTDDASQPPAEPAWGAPRPRSGWSPKLTLAAVGVAALIAGVGGAAIYAATDGARNDIGRGMHGPGMPGPGGFGPPHGMGPPPPMAGPGGPGMGGPGGPPPGMPPPGGPPPGGPPPGMPPAPPLHGQFVVSDGNGGYLTQLTQTGVLTAASDKEITARSADGFTQTYVLGPDSRTANSQLAVDDTVTIHATLANGTATADAVLQGPLGGPGDGPPPGWPPPPPHN